MRYPEEVLCLHEFCAAWVMNGILPLTLCTQTAAIAVYYIADEGIVFHAQMISALNLRATYQVFFAKREASVDRDCPCLVPSVVIEAIPLLQSL